jgi:hypothetical protein
LTQLGILRLTAFGRQTVYPGQLEVKKFGAGAAVQATVTWSRQHLMWSSGESSGESLRGGTGLPLCTYGELSAKDE